MENNYLEVCNELWKEACQIAATNKYIVTLKAQKKSPVTAVEENTIKLKLDNGNENAKVTKNHFITVFGKLIDKNEIQQKDVKGTEERYVLGLMSMMPYFKRKVIRTHKPNYYISFHEENMESFLKELNLQKI
ncbi:hypothetical protein EU245_08480 [Lentibacillus lipolyticus]|nr:hypothetical protein EU245_08480 [Lentibacillus lipolyticus]